MESPYPKTDDIRRALVERADEFVKLTGSSRSAIGKSTVNDPAFFSDVAEGRNFTIGTYEKVMSWLDANWPKSSGLAQ